MARIVLAGIGLAALGACSMAPAYRPPQMAMPAAYKEQGPWVAAGSIPAIDPAASQWWEAFGDPVLDRLERQVVTGSPSLAIALARHDATRADLREARSDLLPHLGVGADLSRNRQSDDRPLRGSTQPDYYGADTLGGEVSYEADLWGRVRDSVAARNAEADASGDDLAAARLSLQAQLASAYVGLRGDDREIELLQATVDAYAEADAMTRRRFSGGIADGVETGQSATQLAEAQAQLAAARQARALVQHAIADLIGASASTFDLPAAATRLELPRVPVALPSTLLEQRPDIAAAQQRMFAANRRIGVARAAFFPSLSLGGTGGWQSTAIAGLVSAPNVFWSLGPGALLSVFDGGRNKARLAKARADWAEATGEYRAVTLGAIRDVEDQLASLHYLSEEAAAEQQATRQAQQVETLSLNRYRKGAVGYLDVVTAQTASLRTGRESISLDTRRLQTTIALIRAVGGGWHAPTTEAAADAGTSHRSGSSS